MKLYGHPDSGHALKVKFCLEAAQIKHGYKTVDIFVDKSQRDPEFVAKSKFCEVPLLLDGDKNLIQSNAILIYIAQKYNIFGADSQPIFQQCLQWLIWEANKIGMCLPQLRADCKFKDQGFGLGPGAKQWLEARYQNDVAVLDKELEDGRPFIIGDQVTIADFSLCGYLMYADEANVVVPDNVIHWLDRLRAIKGWSDPQTLLSSEGC